jgi:hypothetical protein
VLSGNIKKQAENLPRMTCDDLVRNGPGKNTYVTLTDVMLCSRGHAMARDMDAAMQMYVPIYSRNGREPEPVELTLVLEVHDDRDRELLLAQPDIGELNCQVDRTIDDIDPGFIKTLETKYAGIRVLKMRMVSVGLHEPTLVKSQRVWWHGIVSVLLGWVALGLFMKWMIRPTLNYLRRSSFPA